MPALASVPSCAVPSRDASRWFAEEIQPHESALRRYLRFRFPKIRDQDDLVQETYARVLAAFRNGPVTHPKTFLFTTARHMAIDLLRHEQVIRIDALDEPGSSPVMDEQPDAAQLAMQSQEAQAVAEAIRSLPDRCRQVFTLRKVYGLSYDEIARELGISQGTVNVQVSAGIERCRRYLASRGFGRRNSP